MTMIIWRAHITLMEHVYFTSREIGTLYETEPVLGNYALAYALGLCQAPYDWSGPPRYRDDLAPLNAQGIYVTPGTFDMQTLRYAFTQFNGQVDTYYFRFDQNAIGTEPAKKTRAANFPQNGKLRMLGLGSEATCFLLSNGNGEAPRLPAYIRLGKFNSKARVTWERLTLLTPQPETGEHAINYLLNAADLPPALTLGLRAFSLYNLYPAPLISACQLAGAFWHAHDAQGRSIYIPAGLRFGVDAIGS